MIHSFQITNDFTLLMMTLARVYSVNGGLNADAAKVGLVVELGAGYVLLPRISHVFTLADVFEWQW
jgi:hypothetical protein